MPFYVHCTSGSIKLNGNQCRSSRELRDFDLGYTTISAGYIFQQWPKKGYILVYNSVPGVHICSIRYDKDQFSVSRSLPTDTCNFFGQVSPHEDAPSLILSLMYQCFDSFSMTTTATYQLMSSLYSWKYPAEISMNHYSLLRYMIVEYQLHVHVYEGLFTDILLFVTKWFSYLFLFVWSGDKENAILRCV